MIGRRWVLLMVMFSGLVSGAAEPPSVNDPIERQRLVDEMRSAARSNRTTVELTVPHFSEALGQKSTVFAVNLIVEPVTFELAVHSRLGVETKLGEFTVAPRHHIELELGKILNTAGVSLDEGSLELSFAGDEDTLSAWLVLARGTQVVEMKFHEYPSAGARRVTAFWDPRLASIAAPTLFLANTSSIPSSFRVVSGRGAFENPPQVGVLGPYESRRLTFSAEERRQIHWIKVEKSGDGGALAVEALLDGAEILSRLPVLGDEELSASNVYHAIRLPGRLSAETLPRGGPSGALTVFNPGKEAQRVVVELVRLDGGTIASRTTLRLDPLSVGSVMMDALTTSLARSEAEREFRLDVRAEHPVHVHAFQQLARNQTADVAFFKPEYAHGYGTYLIPDLSTHHVFVTLLNLGEQEESIVGQVFWDGGEYAIGPLAINPLSSLRIDLGQLVGNGQPDLAGNRLPHRLPQGIFKWLSRAGATPVLGRLEAEPIGTGDSFGFNSYNCCSQRPFGIVVPESVDFLPGETVGAQAGERYLTCQGWMGPYPILPRSITSPYPFSWDGAWVTATDAALEDLSFNDEAFELTERCVERSRGIFGRFRALTCRRHLLHDGLFSWSVTRSCNAQTSFCTPCKNCCTAKFQYAVCLRTPLTLAEQDYRTCLTLCEVDRCE